MVDNSAGRVCPVHTLAYTVSGVGRLFFKAICLIDWLLLSSWKKLKGIFKNSFSTYLKNPIKQIGNSPDVPAPKVVKITKMEKTKN